MTDWPTRIAGMSRDEAKALRDNAIRLGNTEVLELCNAALSRSSPTQVRVKGSENTRRNATVSGFHFVCPQEAGIIRNPDGTVWTGTGLSTYITPSVALGFVHTWRFTPQSQNRPTCRVQ